MKKSLLAMLIATSALTGFAQSSGIAAQLAQKLEGTVYVLPQRETADGALRACGLEFNEIKRDFSTKLGAPLSIVGSFYLRQNEQAGLVYTMKMGLFDKFGNTTNPVAPANAFIFAPQGKAPKKALRVDSDTPGYALFVGSFDDDVMAAYKAIFEQKKLGVGFNRVAGQQDVSATIDLTVIDVNIVDGKVVRTRSNDAVDDFSSCVGDLLKPSKAAGAGSAR